MTKASEAEYTSSNDRVVKALAWQPKPKVSQVRTLTGNVVRHAERCAAELPQSQEAAFDQAVVDNVEALDMTPEEAIDSVIEEYKLQGADLSDVIQTIDGADISRHPCKLAVDVLLETTRSSECEDGFDDAVTDLKSKLLHAERAKRLENLAVSRHAFALHRMLLICTSPEVPTRMLLPLLEICTHLMQATAIRDSFAVVGKLDGREFNGPHIAATLLRSAERDREIVSSVARMCAAAASGCEDAKCKLMESDFPKAAVAQLQHQSTDVAQVAALCMALKALMTHDDDRPPASKAFVHARMLASECQAVPAMLRAVQKCRSDASALGLAIGSLQQLCANDDICREVLDCGGVTIALDTAESHPKDARIVAATYGLLRQLAKSDVVKVLLVERGHLTTLTKVLDEHKTVSKVVVQVLGLLATIMLRHPDHCTAVFAEEGCLEHLMDAMREHSKNAAVNRQACQALRNLVARNKEFAAPLQAKGAEALLRAAKALPDCSDVAAGAMRDIGIENYTQ